MIDIKCYIVYNLSMFNIKKNTSIIIVILVLAFIFSSCFKMPEDIQNKQELPTPTPGLSFPEAEITMMLKTEDFVMEDWAVMDRLFRESGISCVITTIRPERYSETLNLNLSSGKIYDVMEIAPEYSEAADQYIVDAAPLINSFAPNYINWINTFSPQMLSSLATPLGEIKIFPFRQDVGVISAVPFIKKETDGRQFDAGSFYNAIINSGGRFAVPGSTTMLCELMAPFYGTSVDAYMKDDVLVYGPTTDEFKAMLLYLNSLYQNNMISESFFVYSPTSLLYDITSGDVTVGIFTEEYYEAAYESGMEPFMFSPVDGASLPGYKYEPASYAGISNANGKQEYAMKFIDFCFSDKGRSLLNSGIEGLHVKEYDNGTLKALEPYTRYDAYQWKEQGLTPEGLPGVYYNSWMKFSEPLYELLIPMRKFAPNEDMLVAALPVTGAQAVSSQVIMGELNPLYHEWWSEFIVGSKSLSTDWNSYIRDINGAGINIYINMHYK